MAKKRGLAANRGLDSLLSSIKSEQHQSADHAHLTEIAVNKLQAGQYQPRQHMDANALKELAESIKQHGVMQPIVIRPISTTDAVITHEIIAGERRWRAAKLAGLTTIPAIVRQLSDELAIALALIENIQRENLSALEQAQALQRFRDEFDMSHAQIATTVGKARTTVSNLLRLLNLNDDIKQMLHQNKLDVGHARALLSLTSLQQTQLAQQVIKQELTVRETEALVKQHLDIGASKQPKHTNEVDVNQRQMEEQLTEYLGSKVSITQQANGQGKLTIHYYDYDEFDYILEQLKK